MFLIHHWISSQGRYDLFDTCPYIKFLYVKPTILTKLEIKAKFRAKQASFYEMQNLKTQVKSRISVSRSSLRCITFRVSPVMTTSIPVLIYFSSLKKLVKMRELFEGTAKIAILNFSKNPLFMRCSADKCS